MSRGRCIFDEYTKVFPTNESNCCSWEGRIIYAYLHEYKIK